MSKTHWLELYENIYFIQEERGTREPLISKFQAQ